MAAYRHFSMATCMHVQALLETCKPSWPLEKNFRYAMPITASVTLNMLLLPPPNLFNFANYSMRPI